ncbi:hypothetical protein PGTUg99_017584 [Puccinia graminis f. sp. tritici]|uniref:Uncharacterized protein n=1 Tax=Puccinia graminis f. sp. tritici TaxID=56615 RepID=A0A5B0NF72_PUCGR|nr:hypothetical protein PGTUg99_017584 [Puccinia graminis f. sp. tritici]
MVSARSRVLAEETQYQEYDGTTTESDSSASKTHARITAVHLDYILFMENTALTAGGSQAAAPSPNQVWSRMVAKPPPPPWKQNLKALTWSQFQSGVIEHLRPVEDYFDRFLERQNLAGLIHWIAMISGNSTYSIKNAVEITSPQDFKLFVREALLRFPAKVIFRLEMNDPRETKRSRSRFGPPEVRATLERHHKRQQINSDDAGGEALLNMVADVRESIHLNSGGNGSEYPSFVNPEDPSMEMRVLYKEIWDWAKAILAEEDGVDLTHPPQGPK